MRLLLYIVFCLFAGTVLAEDDNTVNSLRENYCKKVIADSIGVYTYKEKIFAYDSLIVYTKNRDIHSFIYYLGEKADEIKLHGDISAAYYCYKQFLYYCKSNGRILTEKEIARVRKAELELPNMILSVDCAEEALRYSFDLLDRYDDLSADELVCVYVSIACCYVGSNNEKGMEYMRKAFELFAKHGNGDFQTEAKLYNAYAGFLMYGNKVDSALYYLDKVLSISTSSYKKMNYLNIYLNYVAICNHVGDHLLALRYLKSAETEFGTYNDYRKGKILYEMGNTYLLMGEEDNAFDCWERALECAEDAGEITIQFKVRHKLAELMERKGRMGEAFAYMESAYMLKDSFYMRKITERQRLGLLETTSGNDALSLTEVPDEWKYAFGGIVSLFMLAILWLVFRFRKTVKRYAGLVQTASNECREKISSMDKLLLSEMKDGILKNDVLKNVKVLVGKMHDARSMLQIRKICDETKRELMRCESRDSFLEDVYVQFKTSYPEFVKNLKSACPALNDNELNMCILIASGMPAKKISVLNNCSIRSVETVVYRLRKKMNIAPETKTCVYLKSFMK